MAGQNVLSDSGVRRTALWIALVFGAVAGLGYFAYPRLAAIWLVLFVFAVATLPQAAIGWFRHQRALRNTDAIAQANDSQQS
jgi:hypothetical protein